MFSVAFTLLTLWSHSEAAKPVPCLANRCVIGLRIHHAIPLTDDTRRWLDEQLAEANRLFAATGLAFTVTATTALPEDLARPMTRDDRDRLGHDRFAKGQIDVYLVSYLGDVDVPGQEIRGVHWRSQKDRSRRWVILSTISPPRVLAHELGHFFGLPHSHYPESIMNKAPRQNPPPEARRFADRELRRIALRAKDLLRDHALVPVVLP